MRPLIQKMTNELEAEAHARWDDREFLVQVSEELAFRERKTAQTLKSRVDERIKNLPRKTKQPQAKQPRATSPAAKIKETGVVTRPALRSSSPPPLDDKPLKSDALSLFPSAKEDAAPDDEIEEFFSTPIDSQPEAHSRPKLARQNTIITISPCGTKGLPERWVRPEQEDEFADSFEPTGDNVEDFAAILELWVGELERTGGGTKITVEHGVRQESAGGRFIYTFSYIDEGLINEDAPARVKVGGLESAGTIIGVSQGVLRLALEEDLGQEIGVAVITIDDNYLIICLRDQFQKLREGKLAFNKGLADAGLGCEAAEAFVLPTDWTMPAPSNRFNKEQRGFIDSALTSSLSFLWGPPGTGKTKTLAHLAYSSYTLGRRVLLLSNTNLAVDHLLRGVCEYLEREADPSFGKGVAIRAGKAQDEILKESFGDHINIDLIAERLGKNYKAELDKKTEEMARLNAALSRHLDKLAQFEQLEDSIRLLESHEDEIAAVESTKNSFEDELRGHYLEIERLKEELEKSKNRSAIWQYLGKYSPEEIEERIVEEKGAVYELKQKCVIADHRLQALAEAIPELSEVIDSLRHSLRWTQRSDEENAAASVRLELAPIQDRIKELRAAIDSIKLEVIKNCKILATTVTSYYLHPQDFANFDVVLIDEASMILLPAAYLCMGASKAQVVIAGDFMQIPPIVVSESATIKEHVGTDVFRRSGVASVARQERKPKPPVHRLEEQFRMHESICKPISKQFYEGVLRTSEGRESKGFKFPEPTPGPIMLVDSSGSHPFASVKIGGYSRYNILHAIAIRNLAVHLKKLECSEKGIGLTTPYKAQAELLKKLVGENNVKAEVGTVHRFQGNERDILIVDLVDSYGSRGVSRFLDCTGKEETGARLLNVAFSRPREMLVIVANLSYLEKKPPSNSILRDLLCTYQNIGKCIPISDLLALGPSTIPSELLVKISGIDYDAEKMSLFNQRSFDSACPVDVMNARRSIIIFSGFCTARRIASWADIFRRKLEDGVKVRCVTRPPESQGNVSVESSSEALEALAELGVTVDLRSSIHEKFIVIDEEVVWHGSLNALSHTGSTDESMLRIPSKELAATLLGMTSAKRGSRGAAPGGHAAQENPTCPDCSNPTIFCTGRNFTPYFKCTGCTWKANYDRPIRSTAEKTAGKKKARKSGRACPKCGKDLLIRSGRRGADFLGCSGFPRCKHTEEVGGEDGTDE